MDHIETFVFIGIRIDAQNALFCTRVMLPVFFYSYWNCCLTFLPGGGWEGEETLTSITAATVAYPSYRYVLSWTYRVFKQTKPEKVSRLTSCHYLLGRTLLGTFLMSREQADNKYFVTGILISVPWNVTKACKNVEGSWLMRKMGEHLSYHLRNVVVKWVYFIRNGNSALSDRSNPFRVE